MREGSEIWCSSAHLSPLFFSAMFVVRDFFEQQKALRRGATVSFSKTDHDSAWRAKFAVDLHDVIHVTDFEQVWTIAKENT